VTPLYFQGTVFYCEDYLNTDVIAPGRYDPIYEKNKLAQIALIDYSPIEPFVDPNKGFSKFSFIIGGIDFGCGSSRETAPMAIAAAGCKIIIAKSFARIFFRNCINMGLIYPIILDHPFGNEIHGKNISVDFKDRVIQYENTVLKFCRLSENLEQIFECGGLGPYNKNLLQQHSSKITT